MKTQLLCWAWPFAKNLKHAICTGPKLLLSWCILPLRYSPAICAATVVIAIPFTLWCRNGTLCSWHPCLLCAPVSSPDCHPLCQHCAADLYNTGSVCLRCQNARYLLLEDLCVPHCPSGYFAQRGACKSEWVLDTGAGVPRELLLGNSWEGWTFPRERERQEAHCGAINQTS